MTDVVTNAVSFCMEKNMDVQIILIDDGSTDNTRLKIKQLVQSYDIITPLYHDTRKGIGACFRQGIEKAENDVITWIPADGENDIRELVKYLELLDHVDIVIPFVVNTGVRIWFRRLISSLYLLIINMSFGTTFNYTNGNVMYKRKIFDVISNRSNGFFFQTECLIKAIRMGFIFAEVPVFLKNRISSHSKAVSALNLIAVIRDYVLLFIEVHILRRTGQTRY
ncbi:glycosyltransferase family 2 protein [Elusimicrobiota bacterium]